MKQFFSLTVVAMFALLSGNAMPNTSIKGAQSKHLMRSQTFDRTQKSQGESAPILAQRQRQTITLGSVKEMPTNLNGVGNMTPVSPATPKMMNRVVIYDNNFNNEDHTFGSTSSTDVTGPYNQANGYIYCANNPSSLWGLMYGFGVMGRGGCPLLHAADDPNNRCGLYFTDLDGTQAISVDGYLASLVSGGDNILYSLYDSNTGECLICVGGAMLIGQYGRLSYTFPACSGYHPRVILEITPQNGTYTSVLGITLQAALCDFDLGTPSVQSHTIADDHKSVSVNYTAGNNSNLTRAMLLRYFTPTENTSKISVLKQDFSSFNSFGSNYNSPNLDLAFDDVTIPEIPGGSVSHMARINGAMGFHIKGREYLYNPGFQTASMDLSATDGALTVSFKYRVSDTSIKYTISRFVMTTNGYAMADQRTIAYKRGGSGNEQYGSANTDYTFSYAFPKLNTSVCDPSDVVILVECTTSQSTTNSYYAWIDNIDMYLTNVEAGKTVEIIEQVFDVANGNPITFSNLDLDDERNLYMYTVQGINIDCMFNMEYCGEQYTEDGYYTPVILPRKPEAPIVTVNGEAIETSPENPAILAFGDKISVNSEEGTTVNAKYVATDDTNTLLENTPYTPQAATWDAYSSGRIEATAKKGAMESDPVNFYYEVVLPAVHVLRDESGSSTEEFFPSEWDTPYDTHCPWHTKLQIQSMLLDDETAPTDDAWLPRIRYQYNFYAENSEEPTHTVGPTTTAVGDWFTNVTYPDGFTWGRVQMYLNPVSRYGDIGARQEINFFITSNTDMDPWYFQYEVEGGNTDPHVVYTYDVDRYIEVDEVYIYAKVTSNDYPTRYITNNPLYAGGQPSSSRRKVADSNPYEYSTHPATTTNALSVPLNRNTVNYVEFMVEDPTNTYESSDWSTHIFAPSDGGYTSVESIGYTPLAAPVYYNLQGFRVVNPVKGQTYIVRQGDIVRKMLYR